MSTNDIATQEHLDRDEPPPTDPSPGIRQSLPPPVVNPDDDLETRLAWLAAEVRSTSAEHAKKKRAASVLEAREYKIALVPASTHTPADIDLPKITLALGVDPQRDPTIVGRRWTENEWEFDISDPEELSRTLPLDPNATVADPLPFPAQTSAQRSQRRSKFVIVATALVGILIGALLQRSWTKSNIEAKYAAIPEARVGANVIVRMTEQFYEAWLADLERPTQETADPLEVPQPPAAASTFKSVRTAPAAAKYVPFIHLEPRTKHPTKAKTPTVPNMAAPPKRPSNPYDNNTKSWTDTSTRLHH